MLVLASIILSLAHFNGNLGLINLVALINCRCAALGVKYQNMLVVAYCADCTKNGEKNPFFVNVLYFIFAYFNQKKRKRKPCNKTHKATNKQTNKQISLQKDSLPHMCSSIACVTRVVLVIIVAQYVKSIKKGGGGKRNKTSKLPFPFPFHFSSISSTRNKQTNKFPYSKTHCPACRQST